MLPLLAHGGQITGDEFAFIGLGALVLLGLLALAVRRSARSESASAADDRSDGPAAPEGDPKRDVPGPR